MSTKLTLSLDKKIIEQAKQYAKEQHVSLSSLVENYLQKIVSEYKSNTDSGSSIVEVLSGIINLSPDSDYKEECCQHTMQKHQ